MAGEGDQTEDPALEAPEAEPVFRYAGLTFEEATNQGTYDQFQKLSTTLQQNYTKFADNGIKEIKKNNPKPLKTQLSLTWLEPPKTII